MKSSEFVFLMILGTNLLVSEEVLAWTYKQSTGEMYNKFGVHVGTGYAGNGPDKNNPDSQHKANKGPLPRGEYHIGRAYNHTTLGPIVMNLDPYPETEMHGRSLMRIHGDSIIHPGSASDGCIVINRQVRIFIRDDIDKELLVVR